MSLEERRRWFMAEQRLAFSVRNPRSFMCITGITDDHSRLVERPLNLGRLWTRHSVGMIELERDRRRR